MHKRDFLAQNVTFREQTSIPSQSNSHSACFLSSFSVLEAQGGASAQAGPGLPSPGRRVSAFVPGMQALDQGREEKGDPRSATCVDSSLEGDLWGRSVSFRARGGSSPASPSCVREPGRSGEHTAAGCLHAHACTPVSLLTVTELFVSSVDVPFLMQFIRFQVSDIRDALVTMYKVVPKVQCFLLEKVRYAVLCHPFCLYQDHPCSLLRACARRGVPRGSVVCVLGGEGRGCVQVYKCVCPRVCGCVL